jgi:hypothetical protein
MSRTQLALFALALGCASGPKPDPLHFARVESLGRRMYESDRAAWVATDAALAAGAQQLPVQGWITIPREDGWLVRFIGPCGSDTCTLIDVHVDPAGHASAQPTGTPLLEDDLAEWQARQLAVESQFRRCTPTYNSVVLSDVRDEKPVWLVYLLAASRNEDEVVLGGHYRITVNANGTEILKSEPLSKSCLVAKRDPKSAGLMVTHVLDPEPIETHVFASLAYRTPLYVGTEKGTFEVENGKIREIDTR